MIRCNQFFTIQDNEGQYVDKYTLWYNSDDGKWNYTSYADVIAPLIFCKSREEAKGIVKNLEDNLHKISKDFKRTFLIKELT